MEDNFPTDLTGGRGWFGDANALQMHCIYCALHFYYYYISSPQIIRHYITEVGDPYSKSHGEHTDVGTHLRPSVQDLWQFIRKPLICPGTNASKKVLTCTAGHSHLTHRLRPKAVLLIVHSHYPRILLNTDSDQYGRGLKFCILTSSRLMPKPLICGLYFKDKSQVLLLSR